jgi:hypothetical protein
MYQHLLNIGQVAHIPTLAMQPSFPYLYKPESKCEYHVDAQRHSIKICLTFKRKVLKLIKVGWITFNDTPNMNSNTFPNYASRNGSVKYYRDRKEMSESYKDNHE